MRAPLVGAAKAAAAAARRRLWRAWVRCRRRAPARVRVRWQQRITLPQARAQVRACSSPARDVHRHSGGGGHLVVAPLVSP